VIGVRWALIRPLLTALIFTILFGRIAKLQRRDRFLNQEMKVKQLHLCWSIGEGLLIN